MKQSRVDALVIGAGPSGTVAASMLRKGGHAVRIVEKELFPRFVIGESLLPRCMDALAEAGFLEAVKSHGFQEKFGAKFMHGANVSDFNFSEQFTQGFNWTWQVKRAEFDALLASEVAKMGVQVDYQTEVSAIGFEGTDSTTTVRNAAGELEQIRARFIIDASGYGRVIPRLFNLDRPSNLPPRKALFAHTHDRRRSNYDEPNRIIIVSHAPGVWAWVIPFSDGTTSLGFVGNPSFFADFEGSPEQQFRAIVASEANTRDRFADVELVFAPRTLEGWSVTTDKFFGDGFALTGNVTEFLDPIFSSGVTLATVSGHRAGVLASRQLQGETIDWKTEYVDPTMRGVDVFRTYVMAWYDGSLQKIFYAPNPDPAIKKKICSVLAGYVWDESNLYVKQHQRALKSLAARVLSEAESANAAC